MIYVSTKIKKASAQALEAEDIDAGAFTMTKPAGLVNIVSPGRGLLFHAYTREFADDAPQFPKAEATVRVAESTDLSDAVEELKRSGGHVAYEKKDDVGVSLRIDRTEQGTMLCSSYRLIQNDGRVYQFRFDTPEGCKDEFGPAVREMSDSFAIKK